MNIWILAVYFQILDFLTTILFASRGLREFNPVVIFFIRNFGIWGLIATKLIIIAGITAMYFRHRSAKSKINFRRAISRVNYLYSLIYLDI